MARIDEEPALFRCWLQGDFTKKSVQQYNYKLNSWLVNHKKSGRMPLFLWLYFQFTWRLFIRIRCVAFVNQEFRTRDKAGIIRGKKKHGFGNFFRLS